MVFAAFFFLQQQEFEGLFFAFFSLITGVMIFAPSSQPG